MRTGRDCTGDVTSMSTLLVTASWQNKDDQMEDYAISAPTSKANSEELTDRDVHELPQASETRPEDGKKRR